MSLEYSVAIYTPPTEEEVVFNFVRDGRRGQANLLA